MKQIILVLLILQGLFGFSQDSKSDFSRENFNKDWKFNRFGSSQFEPGIYIEEPDGMELAKYNDSDWRKLNLPHDWGVEGPFRDDLENDTGLLPYSSVLELAGKSRGEGSCACLYLRR